MENLISILLLLIQSEWHPNVVAVREVVCEMKVWWQYSNDREGVVVQRNSLPNSFLVRAKAPLPQTITDHRDAIDIWLIIGRKEVAPDLGIDSQHWEEIRGNKKDFQFLGPIRPR